MNGVAMICDHLRPLEDELKKAGVKETYRGQAWSRNCREWVYFDCYLDTAAIQKRLALPAVIESHVNDDPRSGQERGLVCNEHHDAIIGLYEPQAGKPVIK
jgi:hypothetical protein